MGKIIREGDYIRMVNLSRRPIQGAQIRELIVRNVIHMPPEQIVEKCLELTQEKQIRHLPVMADGTLVGIISMGELARAVILSQEDQI
jgi:CBS domain-containing protein